MKKLGASSEARNISSVQTRTNAPKKIVGLVSANIEAILILVGRQKVLDDG